LLLGYGLLHAVLAAAGYASSLPGHFVATFWPAGGLLLAACVICRRRQRWLLLVASVIAEVAAGLLLDLRSAAQIPVGLTLYVAVVQASIYGLSAMIVERWWRVPLPAGLPKLARATGVVVLVLAAGIAAAAAAPAWYLDLPYFALLQIWFAGHALGAMAVTPVAISWWMSLTGYRGAVTGSRSELVALVVVALGAIYAIFALPMAARYQLAYVLFPVLLWAGMRYPPRYVSLLMLGITSLTAVLTAAGLGPFAPSGDELMLSLLPLQFFLIAAMISALWVSVANYERRRAEESLRGYAQVLAAADDRARRSTATDLHDGIAQEMFGVRFLLSAAQKNLGDVRSAATIANCLEIIDSIIARTRHLIEELDPPWIYELDLTRMITWLGRSLKARAGLQVDIHHPDWTPPLPASDRALLFRSVRELLQNVVRHSGVRRARIDLAVHDDALQITVADAGRGFDIRFEMQGALHGGYGLFSVREQLAANGAYLSVVTAPEHGCVVTIAWPLHRTGHNTAPTQLDSSAEPATEPPS
jgi:signal transduction histidine kinase